MYEWPGGLNLKFFGPGEFDRPELMDGGFLRELDTLRERCGFPLTITDDARDQEDLDRIYAREIAKGLSYPTTSAHLHIDNTLVRSVDLKPTPPRSGDGSDLNLEERELELTHQILKLWDDGVWTRLGLGIETAHWHIDDTPRLGARRPAFWVAVSR
jgi:hypothetical protein